jgi:hypothetical protein
MSDTTGYYAMRMRSVTSVRQNKNTKKVNIKPDQNRLWNETCDLSIQEQCYLSVK